MNHAQKTISIGIFAHNEGATIEDSLGQLRQQTIFSGPTRPEVLVLENGSRDNTATVAEHVLSREFSDIPCRVIKIARGDKAATWNAFVHQESNSDVQYLVFMDADIEFGERETLERLITTLEKESKAWICAGQIQKDIARQEKKNLLEKMSVRSSELGRNGPPRLAGSLYAGRANVMRDIQMPTGLLVEDGFLRAMVLTNGFSEPEDFSRLFMVPNASHYFAAVTNPLVLFRHERRLAIGTELNIMLFEQLRSLVAQGGCVNEYIATRNRENENWVADMAREKIAQGTFSYHLSAYAFKPLQQWRRLPLDQRWRQWPHAFSRFLFNAAASWSARRALKAGCWSW